MGIDYNNVIVTDGLVGYWDAANTRTYSGNGLTVNALFGGIGGTLVNGVGFSSSYGGYFSFDGVDDYFDTSSNPSVTYTDTFTLDFVARPFAETLTSTEATTGTPGIFGKKYIVEPLNASSNGGLGIALGTNAIEVVEHGSGYMPVLLSYSANLSSYNHFTISVNNRQSSLYINGSFIRQGLQSARPSTIIKNIATFGKGYYGNYNGHMLFYKLYNRALSATEILQNYNATKRRYGL